MAVDTRPAATRPESDIYSALIVIATIVVAAATIFMWWRSHELFGSWLPLGRTIVP
ncbi:MAG TPA: hypothetical protein VGM03_09590 [Phycisphaerae bacterium]|jgi:hypothetical protein